MDMKKLLEAINKFSGEPTQTPGDQVRGDEKAKPSKDGKHPFQGRLVGEMAKVEQELKEKELTLEKRIAEKWQEFKDTLDARPAREGARHPRGHEPQEQYTVIQDDEEMDEVKNPQKWITNKLKNIERMKRPITDKEWEEHQKAMKKDKEEWLKKNPDAAEMFKEQVLTIKEDPFGQWVLVDKHDGHVKQAFDDKEHAYKYWDHYKLSPEEYKIMHGSEYVNSEYEELAEYGTMQNIKPGDTATNNAETDKEDAKKIAQATTTIKQATGSSTTPADIAKSLDKVDQGTATPADQQKLGDVMDVVAQTAKDPQLANQFKQLAQRAKQVAQSKSTKS